VRATAPQTPTPYWEYRYYPYRYAYYRPYPYYAFGYYRPHRPWPNVRDGHIQQI